MGDRTRLVLLSFLMLFVELALIRWAGSNIVYLSFFSNFVLLGSFLGIGIGFLRGRARVNTFPWAPVGLAFLVIFIRGFPVEIDRAGQDLIFFGGDPTGLPPWVTLPVIFVAVAATMAMIAEGVARVFVRFPPLDAYRLDLVGSILGIVGFSALSFLHAPPVVWGVVSGAVFLVLLGRRIRLVDVGAILAVVALLGAEAFTAIHSWSPYYRVTVTEVEDRGFDAWNVSVNGIPHQWVGPIEARREIEPIYFLPYERWTGGAPGDVLVVGAGTGTDVAIALSMGARHVDAVEIDPRIYEIGARLHPDRPYDDPRVDVHIDDGRAFLERSERSYDLILFALPDSLTLVSGQSSLRLESYLFTDEAMRVAREHLRSGGMFAMYNYYRERWLVDRLAGTLEAVYDRAPCLDLAQEAGQLALLTVGRTAAAVECGTPWRAAIEPPAPATDDYPFLYLRERGIPTFYLLTILLILLASVVAVRVGAGRLRSLGGYLDLFFMGVAFLLLETKNVVQFALLFGTTWFVNALVFAGILLTVLGATELSRRVSIRRHGLLYAALFVALAVAWAVPHHTLLALPSWARFAAATGLAFAPIFLANVIFAQRFKGVGASGIAFGANLLGAMLGGVVEYAALMIGYRSLLLVAAAVYALAFLFTPREPRDEPEGAIDRPVQVAAPVPD